MELIQLRLVDLDATIHLIVQPPCLRHYHAIVYPILNLSKPKDSLSHSSHTIPWSFTTKTIKHLDSDISLPAVWRCGCINQNTKTKNSEASKLSYYHGPKHKLPKSKSNQGKKFQILRKFPEIPNQQPWNNTPFPVSPTRYQTSWHLQVFRPISVADYRSWRQVEKSPFRWCSHNIIQVPNEQYQYFRTSTTASLVLLL